MRAVLTGTDFLKHTDGTYKAIETNTNILVEVNVKNYIDEAALDNVVTTNNINEIVYIYKTSTENQMGDIDLSMGEPELLIPTNPTGRTENKVYSFKMYLEEYCANKSITYTKIICEENSVTIPYVEDSDNKLIIRNSYDTTALIDDSYARDNWEFLKLMYDTNPNLIPKTYINDTDLGFDAIGTSIIDNGNFPNFCIKKRFTPADNSIYPKIFKLNTSQELIDLKQNLLSDEYLQEFIYNSSDLLENRLKYYRSVDLIYGSSLDIVNLWTFEASTAFTIQESCDFDDNNQLQYWERPRYLPKYINSDTKDPKTDADQNTKILTSTNTIISGENIKVGDSVKSLVIPNLPFNKSDESVREWTGSTNSVMNEFSISASTLENKIEIQNHVGFFYNITTTDNIKFSDVSQALIMIKTSVSGDTDNSVIKFKPYNYLQVGDIIIVYNNESSLLEEKQIQNIDITYDKLSTYSLNFTDLDLFLTLEEENSNPKYGIVTHNYNYDCRYIYPAAQPGYVTGTACWYGGAFAGGGWHCARCGSWYGSCSGNMCNTWIHYIGSGWSTWYSAGGCIISSYCNDQKPSDINLKKKIEFLEKNKEDINIYAFEYTDDLIEKWKNDKYEDLSGRWIGVMAQELLGTKYENALSKHKDGFYVVNYNLLPNVYLKK
jgi:hypothetical protein